MGIFKKSVSVDDVAKIFARTFLDNIEAAVNELIDLIEKNDKLKISKDKAGDYLFFVFLVYWTLPLFNLYDKRTADKMLHQICSAIAHIIGADIMKIEGSTRKLRDKYTNDLVDNLQIGRGSAWIVDMLVDKNSERSYNLMLSMQVDAFMTGSPVFEWNKLSKDYRVVQ